MMNARIKGLLIGTAAAATYGLNPLFALPLYADGLDTYSVLLLRYLGAIPLLAIMIKARGRSFAVRRDQIVPVVVLGLMLGLSSLGLFLSYRYIDAGIASTLLFVYPLMVALIMAALYHEKLTMQTVVCLLTALVGIFLLSHTSAGAAISAIGVFWVVVSALSYAVYIVIINRSRVNDMPTLPLTFWLPYFRLGHFHRRCGHAGRAYSSVTSFAMAQHLRSRAAADGSQSVADDRGNPHDRPDADSDTRRFRAGDGSGRRCGRFWRSAWRTADCRVDSYTRRGHNGRLGREYCRTDC